MATIKEYNLEQPYWQKAVDAYKRFLSEADALQLWQNACEACKVSPKTEDIDQLDEVFQYLSQKDGIVGVYGASLKLRLRAYKNLLKAKGIAA